MIQWCNTQSITQNMLSAQQMSAIEWFLLCFTLFDLKKPHDFSSMFHLKGLEPRFFRPPMSVYFLTPRPSSFSVSCLFPPYWLYTANSISTRPLFPSSPKIFLSTQAQTWFLPTHFHSTPWLLRYYVLHYFLYLWTFSFLSDTGMPCFIALHRFCIFFKLEAFHQQKDYNSLYRGGLEPNAQYLQSMPISINQVLLPWQVMPEISLAYHMWGWATLQCWFRRPAAFILWFCQLSTWPPQSLLKRKTGQEGCLKGRAWWWLTFFLLTSICSNPSHMTQPNCRRD